MTTSQQETPTIPEGMIPWHGGDRAPADWDGGQVLSRGGRWFDGRRQGYSGVDADQWQNDASHLDIIAYTPRAAAPPPPTQNDDTLVEQVRAARVAALEEAALIAQTYGVPGGYISDAARGVAKAIRTRAALHPPTRVPDSTVDREALIMLIERMCPDKPESNFGHPVGTECEALADAILALIPQEPK